MNPEEKEKLLSGRAEWYKTLDPADKDKSHSGKVHIILALLVTEYYTEKLLFS